MLQRTLAGSVGLMGELVFKRAIIQSSPIIRRVRTDVFLKLVFVSRASHNATRWKYCVQILHGTQQVHNGNFSYDGLW